MPKMRTVHHQFIIAGFKDHISEIHDVKIFVSFRHINFTLLFQLRYNAKIEKESLFQYQHGETLLQASFVSGEGSE